MRSSIFQRELLRSKETSQKVANCWFQFSKFIPEFLEILTSNIKDEVIKERIESIVFEERGEGNESANHAYLYKLALGKIGVEINEVNVESIKHLVKEFEVNCNATFDKEAFSVGVAYGLEIIAEENIEYLLKYSSQSENDTQTLKKTAFFKIHLKNEIEHIKKCEENSLRIMTNDEKSKSFKMGKEMGLFFWKNFWLEATA